MSKVVVYMPEAPGSAPSLDIVQVKLSDQASVLEMLKERKVPLERVGVVDKRSGRLYIAEGAGIMSVHDPYTGNQIIIDPDIQSFIGQVEMAKDWLVLHNVFIDGDGALCMETGAACDIRSTKLQPWTGAMMELTFAS